jgi:PAS domain S-box-containing protein
MPADVLATVFAVLLVVAVIVIVLMDRRKRRASKRLKILREELIAASADASVGRRLAATDGGDIGDLANTINRLFDALVERDEEIQDRDRLFTEFAQTLPEVILIHDERIILANESAAGLVGLASDQLVGRDVADLVKPAYRALFRKSVANRLAGQNVPRRLEIQLINGNEQGLWVEAQSSMIEYRGVAAILTIARDVSYRKSLEASLSRSKRQAQYTLESISEGVITTDNEGRIDYMNRAAEAMSGVGREESSGQ